jgi:hypothetical protein
MDLAHAERLRHRERPAEEVGVRSEEPDVDPLASERPERHHRLERGDAAARDQHVHAASTDCHAPIVRGVAGPGIGTFAPYRCGKSAASVGRDNDASAPAR